MVELQITTLNETQAKNGRLSYLQFTGLFSCYHRPVGSIDSRVTGTCGNRFAFLDSWRMAATLAVGSGKGELEVHGSSRTFPFVWTFFFSTFKFFLCFGSASEALILSCTETLQEDTV